MESIKHSDTGRKTRDFATKVLLTGGLIFLAVVGIQIFGRDKGVVEEEGVVYLNMWDVPDTDTSIPSVRADRAVHVEFIKRHPNIKIRRTRGIMAQGPASSSAFYMAMAGGTGPDLFEMNMRKVGSYIQEGFVQPLDELIADWPDAEKHLREEVKPAISRSLVEEGRPVTHIYGIPTENSVKGVYYRKSAFLEAGLPVNGAAVEDWDWDLLYKYARKLTYPERGRYGLALLMGSWGGWMWMDFAWQAGGDIVRQYAEDPDTGELIALPSLDAPDEAWITADGKDLRKLKHTWRAVYDEEGGVKALEFYHKLRWQKWTRCRSRECAGKNVCFDITPEMLEKGVAVCPECGQEVSIQALKDAERLYTGVLFIEPSGSEMYRNFRQEKQIGMFVWASDGMTVANTEMNPDEIGVMAPPAGPTGIRASSVSCGIWGISSLLKDPAKIQAAWEYIKWQASDEAEEIRVRTFVEAGQGRYLDPVKLKQYGFDEFVKFVPPGWVAAYDATRKYPRVEPYAPNYTNVQTAEMAVFIDAVFTNEDADPAVELASSVQKVNTTIFQEVPEKVMQKRRKIAYILAIVTGVIAIFVVILLAKSIKGLVDAAATRKRMGLKFSQTSVWAAIAFMAPAILTIFIWRYLPLLRGSAMAFMDYRVIGDSTYIGLDNFIMVLTDPVFWHSMWVTGFYVVLSISFQFTAPIVLALLLAEVPRGKVLYRVIYYLPAVTSGLVIMFLWKEFYNPATGLFNTILTYFNLPKGDWLSSGSWWVPMVCIILPGVWAGAGPGCLIYLAALKSVPEDMYEAADIDGASTLQKVTQITLPYLKPLIIINFVGAFIGAFQAMQQIFVMTGGGPGRATHVVGLEIWYNAFMYLKFGYATAEAWIIGSALIGFTVYQLQILKKVRFTTAKM